MKTKLVTMNAAPLMTVLVVVISLLGPGAALSADYRAAVAAREQVSRYYTGIIAGVTDLEAFARIADYAARLAGNDPAIFMALMNGLILDTPAGDAGTWLAIAAGPWGRLLYRLHARWAWVPGSPAPARFGDTGFATADGSNQVQHVWYSVAVAYRWGGGLADLGACYHEWNAPGLLRGLPGTGRGHGTAEDLALSRDAIALGEALAAGEMTPAGVAGWVRALAE